MTRLPSSGERISVPHPMSCAGDERRSAGAARPVLGAVEEWDREELPTGFTWQQEPHHILEICNRWRVHARWWESNQAVWREYFKVTTDSGLLCLIYHDLELDDWYLSRIYD